jgi:hypothetical protein
LNQIRKTKGTRQGEIIVKLNLHCGLVIVLWLGASIAWADSLQLKNGSLIKGKFMGATENEISFRVGSSVQNYSVSDIVSLKFDSETAASEQPPSSILSEPQPSDDAGTKTPAYVTIPAGTRITVRTIDAIDSKQNQVGDRFQASLEEPLRVDGNEIVSRDAGVYGRLAESKESGTFTGRSQLRLELTAFVVNGQTVPIVTGEYKMTGKSRGASTVRRTVGGAAVGSIIGALAGGGEGAAIGAGVGAGAGAGSETITKGDQVKVPSETLIEFTLQQDVSIPTRRD